MTRGTVAATPCPWCGKANDFRGMEDYGIEPGNICSCDHCGRNFVVAKKQPVTMLWLKRTNAKGNL